MTKYILTTEEYWAGLTLRVKNYWKKTAKSSWADFICTHRPNAALYKGSDYVRRRSTNGRCGKAADIVQMDVSKLLSSGFTLKPIEESA